MKKETNELVLPCLRGCIGDWIYYNVVLSFKELYRIDNKHLIKEDKTLDEYLQRGISNRTDKIKQYLLNEDQRYFSSVIVGVYGEMPDWYALNLSRISSEYKLNIIKGVEESLGLLVLSGNEVLFTIDGQHRIEGIKLAISENPDRFVNDELSVMFIAHINDIKGKIRTRKLFATINREAVLPTPNDLAIIDELFAYNITARQLFADYPKFKKNISLTPLTNIDRNDHVHFTNLLTLVAVNKIIFKLSNYKQSKYNGPTLEDRRKLYTLATSFWDFITDNIDIYKQYFSGELKLTQVRNSGPKEPINLLFQPIGLTFMAEIYQYFFKQKRLDALKDKINKINFDLRDGHFSRIYFDPVKNVMLVKNKTVAKKLILYLLGEPIDEQNLIREIARTYSINELSPEFVKLKLPKKI